ncbi:MAG TPA: nucleoside transporter C-terminal domain-containing protein [Candidatus Babeliales bacterium]|nr:nucleoside transporter C-terminal domain-containing protein [Candidatus Babeliales bacterium]
MSSLFNYFIEYNRYLNIVGIIVIIAIAALFSRKRQHINVRLIINALFIQFLIGLAVLKTTIGEQIVEKISLGISKVYLFAQEGITFVFGKLADPTGSWGFIFAIRVLPVIIFFGALTALCFHWGIIQKLVQGISFIVRPLLRTSGAETICAIANSFLGQTEAPLLIRNYLQGMTKSEMLVVMVSGMATISGSILVVFAAMGVPAKHLLAASVMSIPASIMIAKILYPETEVPQTSGETEVTVKPTSSNSFDAIATGTIDGLHLAVNVAAMLIAFIALIAMINHILAFASEQANLLFNLQMPFMSLNLIFSYLFAPFGYLLGFTGTDALIAGQLLGTKVAINELIAYGQMIAMQLPERVVNIMTYALCGFSNFSCIGIQVGGIGALVPEKRHWLTEFGLYAVLGGALSNLLTAMVAGLLI